MMEKQQRLIDGNALVKTFESMGLGENGLIERVFADGVYAVIENAPTIDAVPVVRHAKVLYNVAIEKEECNGYKKRKGLVLQKYTCASCYAAIHEESKFCMECGAKLIWRNEDEN